MEQTKSPYQLFPPLGKEELDKLEESIILHGVQHAISVDVDGAVLDGHHRLAICIKNELDCPRTVVDLSSEDEKIEFVLTMNLARRNLTPAERQDFWNTLRTRGWSYRMIADATGVSHVTVQRGIIKAEAAALEAGEAPISPVEIVGVDGRKRKAAVAAIKPPTPKLATVSGFNIHAAPANSVSMGDSQPKPSPVVEVRPALGTIPELAAAIIGHYDDEQIGDLIAILSRHLGLDTEDTNEV